MLSQEQSENQFDVTVPISDFEELQAYQKGILGILAKVELDSCDQSLKEDIKSVYKLLGHFMMENQVPEFINPKPQQS